MKRLLYLFPILLLAACTPSAPTATDAYLRVNGEYIRTAEGDTFFIRGTNLGEWLNPEGYMLGFRKCNSPRMISDMLCELVGPAEADRFWAAWKDAYITEADLRYIAHTGANTVRLPFHYKLFTDEDYLGLTTAQDGFTRIDSVVSWCRKYDLHVILDMHDAPGGQTGDNIDDSYGYPWLMTQPACQDLFVDIWRRIATHYANEPVILGYELINEPIAHFFAADCDSLNAALEPLYKRTVQAIREVDKHHIILLGGAQWNGTFAGVFTDWTFDDNILYTCHRYGCPATEEGIRDFIQWRDSTHICMYMGETGHNTYEWLADMANVLTSNNIGYTFWPYKKMGRSSWVGYQAPVNWDQVIAFAEGDRSSYQSIREIRPDYGTVHSALFSLLDSCRFEHCTIDSTYIRALHLHP